MTRPWTWPGCGGCTGTGRAAARTGCCPSAWPGAGPAAATRLCGSRRQVYRAGDRHRPGAGHPGHRPRVRPAAAAGPDRHAGRRRPAGPRPAGGARELGDRRRGRAARGGGVPGDHLAVERDPGRVRAAAHRASCWRRASPSGLSVDTTALTGNADMFAIMKLTQGLANAAAEEEFALTARRTLALATIDGARSLGLAEVTGSLSVGKHADLIVVSRHGPEPRHGHRPGAAPGHRGPAGQRGHGDRGRAGAEAGRRTHHAGCRTRRPGRATSARWGHCPAGTSDAVSRAGVSARPRQAKR